MKASCLLLSALVACGSGSEVPPEEVRGIGRVSFVDRGANGFVVDLATGARWTFPPPAGEEVAEVALSPDGRVLAFATSEAGDNLYVADLPDDGDAAATVRAVPGHGRRIQWGVGGYFVYMGDRSDGALGSHLWVDGAAETRPLGEPYRLDVSPVEPRVAFVECAAPAPCAGDVVVENADGDNRTVVASGRVLFLAFTPDGTRLLVIRSVDGAGRLTVHTLEDGSVVDLGAVDSASSSFGNEPVVSPDGDEALAVRPDGALVAIALADGAARTLVAGDTEDSTATRGEFLPTGEIAVLATRYDEAEMSSTSTLRIIGRDELVFEACRGAADTLSSPSGRLLAWRCYAPTITDLEQGAVVATLPSRMNVVALDPDDRGYVYNSRVDAPAHAKIGYATLDGDDLFLGELIAGADETEDPAVVYVP